MSDSTEPSRTRRSLARPKCWSALAAILALTLTEIPVAAQQVSNSAGPTPAAGSFPTAPLAGCVYLPNLSALTSYMGPMGLTCDPSGALRVNVVAGVGNSGATSVTQGTSPWADNITQFGGANVVTGTGASGAGVPRFTFSNDSAIANTGFNALQGGQPNTASNQFFEQTVGPSMQAPGTSATIARAVQGVTGGIPLGTTDTNAANTITSPGTAASKSQSVQGSDGKQLATAAGQTRSTQFIEQSAVAAAASSTTNGAVRTPGSTFTKFVASFSSTQAGTANIQGCLDSACATAFTVGTASVAAGTLQTIPLSVVFPFYRTQFVNGTTAGTITVVSALNAS